ncbi:MAG: bifunctional phosphoribosylaminoimidazolecarboxamide formyltransferase/IMP cyclohydrolase PurH [Candidatus Nephrothrix sp. EaCA]|nr:MAG: bifunctional phosphoribosylaminoimidazolecarboxamide formyltransferase/IMP cyclohydrolase PurH [Candidatus Nephrothrix sp. EaCA]
MTQKISRVLVSVYYKDGLEPLINQLASLKAEFVSTGGTADFIKSLGHDVTPVETLTGYPSIFGGRVKTLHPAVLGGILQRRNESQDASEAAQYKISAIDMVIVDLYPFEETAAKGGSQEEIIEKIDIGGISLIRAAAKNFNDVFVVSSSAQYEKALSVLQTKEGTELSDRLYFAALAFDVSSHYDTAIFSYLKKDQNITRFKVSAGAHRTLRYGENPHQKGAFFGNLDALFQQLNGRELSYNNLADAEAAARLIQEFEETAFVIVKHTNACGAATGASVKEAYQKALAADTVSAFGGVLIANQKIDMAAAEEIHSLFFEILAAPAYEEAALEKLKSKKNRAILLQKEKLPAGLQYRSLFNGILQQETDWKTDAETDLKIVTAQSPTPAEIKALLFASKICKHAKSNAIVLAKDGQLLASGVGQTSRVDALRQAIEKAKKFGFSLEGAVMASDAFFPFPDCVEIANEQGIKAVIQPGGSVKDQESIDFCNAHNMRMAFTGFRHFLH